MPFQPERPRCPRPDRSNWERHRDVYPLSPYRCRQIEPLWPLPTKGAPYRNQWSVGRSSQREVKSRARASFLPSLVPEVIDDSAEAGEDETLHDADYGCAHNYPLGDFPEESGLDLLAEAESDDKGDDGSHYGNPYRKFLNEFRLFHDYCFYPSGASGHPSGRLPEAGRYFSQLWVYLYGMDIASLTLPVVVIDAPTLTICTMPESPSIT